MDFDAARRHMVDSQVRPNDVTDLAIINALSTVQREQFLPSSIRQQAYVERELSYGDGRCLVTARNFAKLLEAATPTRKDLALDIGCGGGYSTAVLARLCEMVVAVESDEALAAKAQEIWSSHEIDNAAVVEADLAAGAKGQGPFDLIVIAAAVEDVPQALLAQLKDGGRLATFLMQDGVCRGVLVVRSKNTFTVKPQFDATARAVLPGFEATKSFTF